MKFIILTLVLYISACATPMTDHSSDGGDIDARLPDAAGIDAAHVLPACMTERCPEPALTLIVVDSVTSNPEPFRKAIAALDCSVRETPCLPIPPAVHWIRATRPIPLQAGAIQLGLTYPGLTCPESIDFYPLEDIGRTSTVILVSIGAPVENEPSCRSYHAVRKEVADCGHTMDDMNDADEALAEIPDMLLAAYEQNRCY